MKNQYQRVLPTVATPSPQAFHLPAGPHILSSFGLFRFKLNTIGTFNYYLSLIPINNLEFPMENQQYRKIS